MFVGLSQSIRPRVSSYPAGSPRVRSRYMKTFVEQIALLAAADRARIEQAVPEAVWAEIADVGQFAWLPLEHNLAVTRAIAETLGPRRTHEFFVELMLTTYRTPLLQSLVDAVLRLRGNDVGMMLQWVAKGFDLMFKDVGRFRVVERTDATASLEVTGLPEAAATDRLWLETVCSSLSSLFTLAKVPGLAALREVDAATGRVVFRLRWGAA